MFGGTDISARWLASANSFDWNVTQSPSHSGIWDAWFGIRNFDTRDLGTWLGRVMPRQSLWSFTNCSVVTMSFSQFSTVALSIEPLFGLEQAPAKSREQIANSKDGFFTISL